IAAPTAPEAAPNSAACLKKSRLLSSTMSPSLVAVLFRHLCSSSRARATRADWPEDFHAALSDADIPIVQVDRRIAVARNEPDLLPQLQTLRLRSEQELAVLVRHVGDLNVLRSVYPRQAFLAAIGLEARIHDRALGRRRADYGGEHEQAVLERGVQP